MLIRSEHLEGIAAGTISLAFRKWRAPTVKAGGTLRTAAGVLAIDSVEVVREDGISAADARAAGYASLDELLAELKAHEGLLYRIRLRLSGPDPRIRLRNQTALTPEELTEVRRRLERLDRASQSGPWTRKVMAAIGSRPGMCAADLAKDLGVEKMRLKADIRKLKELGLTESLEVGYRLSPRGQAVLTGLA